MQKIKIEQGDWVVVCDGKKRCAESANRQANGLVRRPRR